MKQVGEFRQFMEQMVKLSATYIGAAHAKKTEGKEYELPTDAQFKSIFYGFAEIKETLDTLELIETLIAVSSPRSKFIDKDSYIKFLISTYLQEMYILEQRLSAYAKKISRLYKKPNIPSLVKRIVYEPMASIIDVRGAHVHSHRFNDDRLKTVSTLALLQELGHSLDTDLKLEYKSIQGEWKSRIKTNNETTLKIVDQYFRLLKSVMCKENEIIFPCPSESNTKSGRKTHAA